MRLLNYTKYVFQLIRYHVTTMLFMLFEKLVSLSIFPTFFRELVAAYSVGAGKQAFEEKRYAAAFKILKPIADYEIDDPYVGSAQYIVGVLYFYGLGIKKDLQAAEQYFLKAVKRNCNEANKYLKSS